MQNDDARVVDIVLASGEIADFIRGKTRDTYLHDRLLQAALERNIFIVGEAARSLTESFRAQHPTIPWAKIIGTRNILAHEYGRVSQEILWEIATVHLPALVVYLTPLLPGEVE